MPAFGSYIPQIDMQDANFEGDLFGGLEGMDGGGKDILHHVAGEETTEVEGRFCKAVTDEPLAHLADHGQIVVDTRDDEVGEFHPDASLFHGEDGVEDWL